jgi:site-specific recombinase XerD
MLYYTKDWYLWCANQSLDGFDDAEAYWELRDAVIPGNLRGVAVTTADPESGPLFEVEENALRAALQQNTLDLRSTALVWLFLTLGPNPMNLALLRESDLNAYTLANQNFYELKVPRIKKRVPPRAEFKVRKIEKFLGAMLVQLRDQNLEEYPHEKAGSRPLFWSTNGSQALAGWHDFERHTSAADLSIELTKGVERLNVISPVTNLPLRITPRRLRYTFAVRMVRQGCDATILAELLNHTDLQNVLVYYANKGAQKRIDDVTNERFGPLAKRFLGRIVKDETEARGTPATRIKTTINLLDLGSCGLEGDCNKAMPYGCYICPKFLAWHDAPHDRFLDEVKKIAKGAREAVQMNDIINAVGEVVQRCKAQ